MNLRAHERQQKAINSKLNLLNYLDLNKAIIYMVLLECIKISVRRKRETDLIK